MTHFFVRHCESKRPKIEKQKTKIEVIKHKMKEFKGEAVLKLKILKTS